MSELALDAAARVKTLIALTEELTAVIIRENAALEARRPQDLAALQPDKARLAAAYAQSIRAVAADRSSVTSRRRPDRRIARNDESVRGARRTSTRADRRARGERKRDEGDRRRSRKNGGTRLRRKTRKRRAAHPRQQGLINLSAIR